MITIATKGFSFEKINEFNSNNIDDILIFYLPFWTSVICLTLAIICFLAINNRALTLTDKKVYGKTKFGKRVTLPLNQISSLSQGWFGSLSIATPSEEYIKFCFLENRQEISGEISKLLSEAQNPNIQISSPKNNIDVLKEYKELLDSDIITEEEFTAKKKQLLDL